MEIFLSKQRFKVEDFHPSDCHIEFLEVTICDVDVYDIVYIDYEDLEEWIDVTFPCCYGELTADGMPAIDEFRDTDCEIFGIEYLISAGVIDYSLLEYYIKENSTYKLMSIEEVYGLGMNMCDYAIMMRDYGVNQPLWVAVVNSAFAENRHPTFDIDEKIMTQLLSEFDEINNQFKNSIT
jgi:hypothetical protein